MQSILVLGRFPFLEEPLDASPVATTGAGDDVELLSEFNGLGLECHEV